MKNDNIMKKLLFLFAALIALAACDDDAVDYSTWTTEELLATPAGVEYLIQNASPIDYAAIEEELETLVFHPYYFFCLNSDGWSEACDYDGTAISYYFVMDDVVRGCFDTDMTPLMRPDGKYTQSYYIDKKFTGDRLSAILNDWRSDAQIKARVENTLIMEYYDQYGRRWLHLVSLVDMREQLLVDYPYSRDELDYPGTPQN